MSYHTHKWKTPLAKGKARIAQEKWRWNEGYSYWQKNIFPKIPYEHVGARHGARDARSGPSYHTAPVASREERWRKWKYDMQHDIPWSQSSVKKTNWANYYGRKYYRK